MSFLGLPPGHCRQWWQCRSLGWQYRINTTTGAWRYHARYAPGAKVTIFLPHRRHIRWPKPKTAAALSPAVTLSIYGQLMPLVTPVWCHGSHFVAWVRGASPILRAVMQLRLLLVLLLPTPLPSWPAATATAGQSVSHYYYMINVAPPTSQATLTSNPATYIDTGTSTSVVAAALPGVNKGSNTVYVVAVDDGKLQSKQSHYWYIYSQLDWSW